MGKRGLYSTLSTKHESKLTMSYMDFLQYADGLSSLENISKKIKLNIRETKNIFNILKKNKLIK